jgi:hypothetical protein
MADDTGGETRPFEPSERAHMQIRSMPRAHSYLICTLRLAVVDGPPTEPRL